MGGRVGSLSRQIMTILGLPRSIDKTVRTRLFQIIPVVKKTYIPHLISYYASRLSLEELVTGLVIIYACIVTICPVQVDTISLKTQHSPDLYPKFRGLLMTA